VEWLKVKALSSSLSTSKKKKKKDAQASLGLLILPSQPRVLELQACIMTPFHYFLRNGLIDDVHRLSGKSEQGKNQSQLINIYKLASFIMFFKINICITHKCQIYEIAELVK
jgi:tRNA A37 N6-isopentenylltransferase MiaA